MKMRSDFAIFILSHGRADKVLTISTLREKCGYVGKIYIIIDNEDEQADRYRELYGDMVIQFDKSRAAEITDTADLVQDHLSVVYARNMCFSIAKDLGLTYF